MIILRGIDSVTGQNRTLTVGSRAVDTGGNDIAVSLIEDIGSGVIDLNAAGVQRLTTSGALAMSATGQDPEIAKGVTVVLTASGSNITFSFDVNWRWLGTAPLSLADGERGVLSLISVGDGINDIIASYEQVGLG